MSVCVTANHSAGIEVPTFNPSPAQVAERQGRYLARALSHTPSPSSPEPEPFVFKPWGMLAYVGGYQALHDTPYDKSHG